MFKGVRSIHPAVPKRQCHILDNCQTGDQIEILKDKADLHFSNGCQLIILSVCNRASHKQVLTRICNIQQTYNIQQRTFTGPRRADNGTGFPHPNLKIDLTDNRVQLSSMTVTFTYASH